MTSPAQPAIVILDAPPASESLESMAAEAGCLPLEFDPLTFETIPEADAILTWRTPVTAAMIARARRCATIVVLGPGRRLVDLESARAAGIFVGSIPDGASETWSARAWELIHAVSGRTAEADSPRPLRGLRLGIVGLGSVGRRVARKALDGGMTLLAHDPFCPKNHFDVLGARELPLDELLGSAQIVSLHVPQGPETRGMIDARRLDFLQRGSGLVCCASPHLIDFDAMLRTLRRGRPERAAFAWDAPLPEPLLLSRDPHLILNRESLEPSPEEARASFEAALAIVKTTLAGGRPRHLLMDPPCPRPSPEAV